MANWKKVIVSGSQAELAGITGSLLTDDRLLGARDGGAIYSTDVEINDNGHLDGEFSGSFNGDGSGLTGVVAQIENSLVDGAGIQDFTFDGSSEVTVSVDSGSLAGDGITAKADGTGFTADLSGSTLTLSSDGIGVAADGITNTEMADNSVDSDQYVDGSIEFIHLDGAAVVTGAEGITSANTGSDDNLPTTKAVKDYVDDQLGAADLDITGDNGDDSIDLDDDTLNFAGGTNITTTVTAGDVSIALDDRITVIDASGSFSGSFEGDGSGLTGLATTLTVDGDAGTADTDLINDDLQIIGTQYEIETSVAKVGQEVQVTVGLPDDVTIGNNLTVTNDLIVLGDTTTLSTTNLLVEDAFILVASGSTGNVDGGIIVDGGDDNGEGFVYDTSATNGIASHDAGRWGFEQGMGDTDNSATPNAFASAVVIGTDNTVPANTNRYSAKGNMFIASNEDIYIWS